MTEMPNMAIVKASDKTLYLKMQEQEEEHIEDERLETTALAE